MNQKVSDKQSTKLEVVAREQRTQREMLAAHLYETWYNWPFDLRRSAVDALLNAMDL